MGKYQIIFGRQAVIEAVEASKTITKVFIQRDLNKSSAERLIRTLENATTPIPMFPFKSLTN
ncbi:MAG: hypothetical protein CM15mP59_3890 [Flavobacteriaceae bacterium]|nr:MAG: hypothetical protein CM15mP59_3890 [Flavobacteriaceae bacterium]